LQRNTFKALVSSSGSLKEEMVIAQDSVAGDFVKPNLQKALDKMGSVLKVADASCNLDKWAFATGKITFLSRPMAMIVASTLASVQDVRQDIGL